MTTMTVAPSEAVSTTAPAKRAGLSSTSSLESLFYQNLRVLGTIAREHRDWQDRHLSFYLHQWIVDLLKTYLRTPMPDSELQKDIKRRLQNLKEILVDSLERAPLEEIMIDREWVWNKKVVEDYQHLVALALNTPGIAAWHNRLCAGAVVLSPFDGKPMELREHAFAKAMLAWLSVLPMHLFSTNESSSSSTSASSSAPISSLLPSGVKREKEELKKEERQVQSEEQSVVPSSPRTLTPQELMRLMTYLMVAQSARERLFDTVRDEDIRARETKFEETTRKLVEEGHELARQAEEAQIAFERSIREQITVLDETHQADKTRLKAEIGELKERNEANERTISSHVSTINHLANQVSQLQVALATRKVEVQHIYHEVRRGRGFCVIA